MPSAYLSPIFFPSLGIHPLGLTALHFPKPALYRAVSHTEEGEDKALALGSWPERGLHLLISQTAFYTWPLTDLQTRRRPRSRQPACLSQPLDGALGPLWELLHPSSK